MWEETHFQNSSDLRRNVTVFNSSQSLCRLFFANWVSTTNVAAFYNAAKISSPKQFSLNNTSLRIYYACKMVIALRTSPPSTTTNTRETNWNEYFIIFTAGWILWNMLARVNALHSSAHCSAHIEVMRSYFFTTIESSTLVPAWTE